MAELSIKHPGFYRYTTKEKFNYLIDSTNQTISDSMTVWVSRKDVEMEFVLQLIKKG